MTKRTFAACASLAAMTLAVLPSAGAAPASDAPQTEREALTSYVMQRDGVDRAEANRYLQVKDGKQGSLRSLQAQGVGKDGAYFKGEKLYVPVKSKAQADKVRAKGLTPTFGAGQSELNAVSKKVAAIPGAAKYLRSTGSDLPNGKVQVRISADAPESFRQKVKNAGPVTMVEAGDNVTHADVVPGQIMKLASGGNCSLGFPGKTSDGNNVLLTAGHCVEGLPEIQNDAGERLGEGVDSRFTEGQASVDMGLMDIDEGNTGVPRVDSRGHSGFYDVEGMSKNAVGTELCKAGNTTGWTCGTITGYDRTVNYGGTVVSGLAESTVCTEPGDSGGAYIGVGNLAQGMTSGGPVGAECGWNQDYNASGSYSFYQPVVDAAQYYGVTIDTVS